MKPLIMIFVSLHFLTASVVYSSEQPQAYIHQIASSEENVFVLKAGKQWKGAKVEVISESGDRVIQQKLFKQRMSIDFSAVEKGTYLIKISKNKMEKQFAYSRY